MKQEAVSRFGGRCASLPEPRIDEAMAEADDNDIDQLDAFFAAADARRPEEMRLAAEGISKTRSFPAPDLNEPPPAESRNTERKKKRRRPTSAVPLTGKEGDVVISDTAMYQMTTQPEPEAAADPDFDPDDDDLDGKYIAIDPDAIPGVKSGEPFVLVPAHIHTYVPWWGWVTIGMGLLVFATAVIVMPGISLNRLVSRLGEGNEAAAQKTMRQLVVQGDERTVKKLFSVASSSQEGLKARLRAVDTMSLIERVPEVDRALLRLELSSGTHEQVREAAIAARKQREAYRTRTKQR
jgi:hypothetical protein